MIGLRRGVLRSLLLLPVLSILCSPLSAQGSPEVQNSSLLSKEPSSQQSADWEIAAGKNLNFEVASVREDASGESKRPSFPLSSDDSWSPTGGYFHADFPPFVYICFAYKIMPSPDLIKSMVSEVPSWVGTDRFEIIARASGEPTKDQYRLMIRNLLSERFNLQVHFEERPMPVFALTLMKQGKTGPKLTAHTPLCSKDGQVLPSTPLDIFPPPCLAGAFMVLSRPNHAFLVGTRDNTLPLIAEVLSQFARLDRPIVDQTGLIGKWDFSLEFSPEDTATIAEAQPAVATETFADALRDQLGLKLVGTRAAVRILVLDHIEKPGPN